MLPVAQVTCSLFLNIYNLYIASHRGTGENLVTVSMICTSPSKESEKCLLFVGWLHLSERYQQSGFLFQPYPNIFRTLQKMKLDKVQKKTRFQGLLSKLCTNSFVKNLALMADVLNELKNLSETLQNRSTTLPKAQNLLTVYIRRIESLVVSPGEHSILAQRVEAMSFQEVQLREGRGPIINQAQFIRAVADNMKLRLFTTVSTRGQASVVSTRQEMYENLLSQIAVLNPHNWVHENHRFGENEVKSLCKTFHLNNQEIPLGFIEYKSSALAVIFITSQVVEEVF